MSLRGVRRTGNVRELEESESFLVYSSHFRVWAVIAVLV